MTSPAESPARTPRGLIRFGAAGPKARRIYCLPFAGGGPSTYRLWPRLLPADVEVIAVQLPGRDPASPDPPADSIDAIVTAVGAAILELEEREPLPFADLRPQHGRARGVRAHGGAGGSRRAVAGPAAACRAVGHPTSSTTATACTPWPTRSSSTRCSGPTAGSPTSCATSRSCWRCSCRRCARTSGRSRPTRPLTGRQVQCPVRVYGGARDRNPRPSQLAGWQRVAARDVTIRVFEGDHFYLADGREALTADIAGLG